MATPGAKVRVWDGSDAMLYQVVWRVAWSDGARNGLKADGGQRAILKMLGIEEGGLLTAPVHEVLPADGEDPWTDEERASR